MTNSVPSSESYPSTLSSYLQDLLPGAQVRQTELGSSHAPLVLLHTDHVLAAFVFSKEDVRQSYNTVYSDFKNYYKQQSREWDKFDLAFVFCLLPQFTHFDEFYSTIETDVYFCRKFVVPFVEPLNQSLACLPFLPLEPLKGQSLRPPSAQTFLQNCGVQATLAKYIVMQGERGIERIAEDCLSGDFGGPAELKPSEDKPSKLPDSFRRPVTIENITIQNFRAYRKPLTFSFGRDVTVLYGANGFGKTSFFDAFDFVTTGDVGRIKFQRDDDFESIIPHLDSNPDESTVSLSFLHENALRKLVRNVRQRQYAQLDAVRSDRKRVLAELTGGNFDRVDNFVSLFRATHLFNQEHQELTKDFDNNCRLPSEIVARMLAFEDYVSAISRSGKLKEQINKAITKASADFNQLTLQINDEKEQLARLSRIGKAPTGLEALEIELMSLRKALNALAIATDDGTPDAAEIRGWRASLEARLEESLNRSERLSSLINDLPLLIERQSAVIELRKQIADTEKTLSIAETSKTSAQANARTAEKAITGNNQTLIETRNKIQDIDWVLNIKPEFERLQEQTKLVAAAIKKTDGSLLQSRRNLELATQQLSDSVEIEKRKSDQKRLCEEQLARAEILLKSLAVFSENQARIGILDELEESTNESQDTLTTEAAELASIAEELASEEQRISAEVAGLERQQTELKELISQLLDHIHTGTCPLCGDEHGSREGLIRKIKTHGSIDIAIEARARLGDVGKRQSELKQQTEVNIQKQRAVKRELNELAKERATLLSANAKIEFVARELGLVLDGTSELTAQAESIIHLISSEIEQLNDELLSLISASSAKRRDLELLQKAVDTSSEELERLNASLGRLEQQSSQISADPRASRVSFEAGENEIAKSKTAAEARIAEITAELSKLQNMLAEKESEVTKHLNEITESNTHAETLRRELTNSERTISEVVARLEVLGLDAECKPETLQKKVTEESKLQAQIAAMSDKASSIEIAIDTATTAAALTQLQQNVRNREKAADLAAKTQKENEPWLHYFGEVSELLSTQQNQAIASFTKEYGPRTSIIQRRLRSVYGFDDIDIQSDGSEILVRVSRNGQVLKPSQFFSQSQQQTLFLGLFLTACISQTWSAFSPIFLDDPVTHFDDLNTYAFLDLVVGLLESDSWKRQFVISTCDEKLLQLARQKFRHLGDSAKFYRFVAIGEDGPVIDEL